MTKRKSPRQRPPTQSQTERPQQRSSLKKQPSAPKRGTIHLTVFEAAAFQEMVAENQRLAQQREALEAQSRNPQARHDKAVKAFGQTHKLPPVFSVQLNKTGDGLNWNEVREDAKDNPGTGTETPDPGD